MSRTFSISSNKTCNEERIAAIIFYAWRKSNVLRYMVKSNVKHEFWTANYYFYYIFLQLFTRRLSSIISILLIDFKSLNSSLINVLLPAANNDDNHMGIYKMQDIPVISDISFGFLQNQCRLAVGWKLWYRWCSRLLRLFRHICNHLHNVAIYIFL